MPCSARRPPATPRSSRALPSNAWPSTISTAGACPICADPGELSYHLMRDRK